MAWPYKAKGTIAALIALVLVAVVIGYSLVRIDAEERGVHWARFSGGTDLEKTLGEGMHWVWPWDRVYVYDMTEQESNFSLDVLNARGEAVAVAVQCTVQLLPESVALLHKEVGPEYMQRVVVPELSAFLREKWGRDEGKGNGAALSESIYQEAKMALGERYVRLLALSCEEG